MLYIFQLLHVWYQWRITLQCLKNDEWNIFFALKYVILFCWVMIKLIISSLIDVIWQYVYIYRYMLLIFLGIHWMLAKQGIASASGEHLLFIDTVSYAMTWSRITLDCIKHHSGECVSYIRHRIHYMNSHGFTIRQKFGLQFVSMI